MSVKVNILFPVSSNPIGGGNQFLGSLKKEFANMGVYASKEEADILLFNSHQNIRNVIKAKKMFRNKLFIHRVDGPIRLYNSMDDMRDGVVNMSNKYLADATIFQSEFSLKSNYEMGLEKNKYSTIIYNAVDEDYFHFGSREKKDTKTKLIACSWSSNYKKGFDVYEYLDSNLDFNKYEMTFVGNSPIKFKNIKIIEPLKSGDLADELRKHDIYISASRNDPCSNSVLEALACGLPVICRNEGGHPELIKISGNAGETFSKPEEVLSILEKVSGDYNAYRRKIIPSDIKNAAQRYYSFMEKIFIESNGERKDYSLKAASEIHKALFRWEHERIAKILHI